MLLVLSCNSNKEKETTVETKEQKPAPIDSLLVTENSWGAITSTTDLAGLKKIYGDLPVTDSTIMGPEGIDTLEVTYIHPGTEKELLIYWKDSLYHKTIGAIESYQPNAPYKTAQGLKIGSTLKELLEINQKPITFSGFGWDYGGYIMSYNKGRLDSSRINFRLEGDEKLPMGLDGDSDFNTDMPLVTNNLHLIRVYAMTLNFYGR